MQASIQTAFSRANTLVLGSPSTQNCSAVSLEAQFVGHALGIIQRETEEAHSLFGARMKLISELGQLQDECSIPNWDGEESAPLSESAVRNAEKLIRLLPENLPMPEVSPEPDGSISLDWMPSQRRILSLSVGDDDYIPFAWLRGISRGRGVADSRSKEFPVEILGLLQVILQK